MAFVFGVVLFAVGIGVSIALHEFGHLLTAKAFGMKVTRYFIGFGPRLFSFRKGETEYGLKVIPAGGFCEIVGMTALETVPEADASRAFYRQKVWKRVVVLSAGSVTHFIVGFVILYLMAASMGLPNVTAAPIVGQISQCVPAVQDNRTLKLPDCGLSDPAPAKQAGLLPGDRVLAVAGRSTPTYPDVVAATRRAQGGTPFVIERDGAQRTVMVDVAKVRRVVDPKAVIGQDNKLEAVGTIGLMWEQTFHYNPLSAVGGATGFTGTMFVNTWEGLKKLPQKVPAVLRAIAGEKDPDRPVSVVGASVIGGDAVSLGAWPVFLLVLASLNFFVGVFNLLPLLPLDGGHIAVNLYERVRDWVRGLRGKPAGGPVDYTRLLPLTYLVVFLGGAMVLLTVTADIVNPIRLGQ